MNCDPFISRLCTDVHLPQAETPTQRQLNNSRRLPSYYRKTTPLNAAPAPSVHLDAEEVVICNPTHPLFGRRFRVHHRIERPGKEPSVLVFFTEEILIRITVSALTEPHEPPTKLTLSSMAELVSTFRVAALSCPSTKPPSGPLSPST